jgi:outer membrane receptor for ferrienterochelin and colicin
MGRILDAKNSQPIPFATVVISGTAKSTVTDSEGNFTLENIRPGYIELKVSSIGYKLYISDPVMVTNAKKAMVEIQLEEMQVVLNEVKVTASFFRKKEESPVSLRRISIDEIERNPGSNRDISKVIQAFPGVASTPAYRNDVIVRGGGSSENRFYLDGVEIPNINHFATQGASGGPAGIINVDFIREVNFYSGAFPANRGNALSSVLEFSQIDGNKDKIKFRGSIGASDLSLTFDGPLSSNTTFIASARKSYLQFLFAALDLPFLPTYNDFQFKIRTRINNHYELMLIGLGAIDYSRLNLDANKTEKQRYTLGYLPEYEQWNYTIGVVFKHYKEKGYDTWVLSRNHLNNISYKYRDNVKLDSLMTLDYNSYEMENKFRWEHNTRTNTGFKINYGLGMEYVQYHNYTRRSLYTAQQLIYTTNLDFFKWSVFGQVSKNYFQDKFTLSFGVRSDANSFSGSMTNLWKQVSPRLSLSYAIKPRWTISGNVGRYYQLPPYTSLGFRNSEGVLINKTNSVTYIQSDHMVGGIEHIFNSETRFSVEGFYKWYRNYPFSVSDSISIASKGADYNIYGDEEIRSDAKGKAYGMEMLLQSKNLMGFNLIVSYTLVRSSATNYRGAFVPTSWDNRHIINITALRSLKRNWEIGFKWRFVGGAPYTPWDLDKSSLVTAWDAKGMAYPDYSKYNQLRLKSFHQLDIRIDKEYFFTHWSLRFYMDVQNLYNFKSEQPDMVYRSADTNGELIPATGNPARYSLKSIKNNQYGTILPTIGFIVEF